MYKIVKIIKKLLFFYVISRKFTKSYFVIFGNFTEINVKIDKISTNINREMKNKYFSNYQKYGSIKRLRLFS